MKIIEQSFDILRIDANPLQHIEQCGRIAYKSEEKIDQGTATPFVDSLRKRGHFSVIEHSGMSVLFVTDRGVSHEIVRHRLASFTQESTRYVGYGDDKGGVTYIRPTWISEEDLAQINTNMRTDKAQASTTAYLWWIGCKQADSAYTGMILMGATPQEARQVLNNSTKTEIIVTANFREWRHIFELRAISKAAHPQMRALMKPLYKKMRYQFPEVFEMGDAE